MENNRYDVIVVGAGISGLLSALALSKEGKKVLVLEKSGVVGGNCRTYEVENTGFFVDTGVHAITGLNGGPLVKLMDKCFSFTPKFVPHGDYYIREKDGLRKFPNTIQSIARFNAIPRKDRLMLTKLLIKAIAEHAIFKNSDITVYNYVSGHNLSPKSLRLLDALSYFLSGVSMKDTPVWRILSGGGITNDNEFKPHKKVGDILRLALNPCYSEQGYPRGGIGTITKCIIESLPKSARIKTCEEVIEINQENILKVTTKNNAYKADKIIYSGEAKRLPELTEMPKEWTDSVRKLKQSKAMTIWLGLKKPINAFNYRGSEVWFSEGISYWGMPTSGYDVHLAPKGKQLIGFSTFMSADENPSNYEKDFLDTIYSVAPEIEKNIEMKHTQIISPPEKAAVSVGVKFPPVQTPVKNLYLVGTDADMRSMGITRASYSVLEMLKAMHL